MTALLSVTSMSRWSLSTGFGPEVALPVASGHPGTRPGSAPAPDAAFTHDVSVLVRDALPA